MSDVDKIEITHNKISRRLKVDGYNWTRQPSFEDYWRKGYVGRSTGKAYPKADGVMKLTGSWSWKDPKADEIKTEDIR